MSVLNRRKVFKNLKATGAQGLAYLKGGSTVLRRWTDVEEAFRQESNFFYLTGANEPDLHLVLDIEKEEAILFCPLHSADHSLWCGEPDSLDEIKAKYGISRVYYSDQLRMAIHSYQSTLGKPVIHVLDTHDIQIEGITLDDSLLKTAITEARVYKTDHELDLMRMAAKISCDAHVNLMKAVKTGHGGEQQLHALYLHTCLASGAPFQAYTPIIASGKSGAILHYNANVNPISSDPLDMILVDAGCEFKCYASDITRTYPVGGVFKDEYKIIYEIVLNSQKALKPGVEYENMHRLALKVICEGLLEAQIVKGNVEELMANHIPALFFPHGLGHLIGIDVHDVGGYPKGVERIQEPGIKYLRLRRKLNVGMVVTVEPGVYFVDAILNPAVNDLETAKFLNIDVLKRFWTKVGGVRIEDDVVITESGIEVLTNGVPKEIKDIEMIMASQ